MIIRKITDDVTVDFAAEELKKYLRMMMPQAGEVEILSKKKKAKVKHIDSFELQLGVMKDFGIPTKEAKDLRFDDIVHIDVKKNGGILAGSNPRSVLFAVYTYLRKNGCRWLYPGFEGEYIPNKPVGPVKYHKAADNRFRGQCDEGAQNQQAVLDMIDFATKLNMNLVSIEFFNPKFYFDSYYNHRNNPSRKAEPVTAEQTLQWTREAEAEISKRGLMFVAIGHGWNAEVFGVSTIDAWSKNDKNEIPKDMLQYFAMINGKRGLYNGTAMNTQFCMSNPKARKMYVDAVVRYARHAQNVTFLATGLADWQMNHCECPECQKMIPSDWYVMLLNELDEAFRKEGLPQIIKFSTYSDTSWAPEHEKLKNPEHFAASLCPITRSYRYSVGKNPVTTPTPYVRNKIGRFDKVEEYYMRSRDWQKAGAKNMWVFDYHFWKAINYAPGVFSFAKRLYEDIRANKVNNLQGMIQDMSKRCFFPNALCFYVYAVSLFDMKIPYEEIVDDYMTVLYGDAKEVVTKFLEAVDKNLRQDFLETIHSKPVNTEHYHDKKEIKRLEKIDAICTRFEKQLEKYTKTERRVQAVGLRLLPYYTEYLRGIAKAFMIKAEGKDEEARAFYDQFFAEFGKKEVEIERYYDQFNTKNAFEAIFKSKITVQM